MCAKHFSGKSHGRDPVGCRAKRVDRNESAGAMPDKALEAGGVVTCRATWVGQQRVSAEGYGRGRLLFTNQRRAFSTSADGNRA